MHFICCVQWSPRIYVYKSTLWVMKTCSDKRDGVSLVEGKLHEYVRVDSSNVYTASHCDSKSEPSILAS